MYSRISLLKKSLLKHFEENLPDLGYSIGSGEGELALLEAFPADINYKTFHWPSMSVEIDDRLPGAQIDLGTGKNINYTVTCDIFARNDLEKELLAENVVNLLEDRRVPIYDFNTSGLSILTYFYPEGVTARAIRLATPEGYEVFRSAVGFTAKVTEF